MASEPEGSHQLVVASATAGPLSKSLQEVSIASLEESEDCLAEQPQPSTEWTAAEQKKLEEVLAQHPPTQYKAMERYVKVAAAFPNKTVRDVTLRVKWMAKQDAAKKRKQEECAKKARPVKQASFVRSQSQQLPAQQDPTPMVVTDPAANAAKDVMPGVIAHLLEQNYAILTHFKNNMAQFKVAENTELLVRFRDNVLAILEHMNSMGGVMAQMPQLPVQLNLELANKFLPKSGSIAMPFPPFPYPAPPATMPAPAVSAPPPLTGMESFFGLPPGMHPGMLPPLPPGMPHLMTPGMPGAMAPPPGLPPGMPSLLPQGPVPVPPGVLLHPGLMPPPGALPGGPLPAGLSLPPMLQPPAMDPSHDKTCYSGPMVTGWQKPTDSKSTEGGKV